MQFKHPGGQLARWLEELSHYDMKIVNRPGRRHVNADALSREAVVTIVNELMPVGQS
jgi:hypothetical protein